MSLEDEHKEIGRKFVKRMDWVSSKGARSVQFCEYKRTSQDNISVTTLSISQSCTSKNTTLEVARYRNGEMAGNPWAGISLSPSEWLLIIEDIRKLSSR